MPQTFGERLRELRKARGLNQYELAEAVLGSASRQAEISRWESNRNEPSHIYLVKLAHHLSVSVDELLGIASIFVSSAQATA